MWVAEYGVTPQTYILTVLPSAGANSVASPDSVLYSFMGRSLAERRVLCVRSYEWGNQGMPNSG